MALLAVLVAGRFMLTVVYDDNRFNPVPVLEAEIQHCKINSDCTEIVTYCGGSCEVAISTVNESRYRELVRKHCELNPPSIMVNVSCGYNLPECVQGVCQMVEHSIDELITSQSMSPFGWTTLSAASPQGCPLLRR